MDSNEKETCGASYRTQTTWASTIDPRSGSWHREGQRVQPAQNFDFLALLLLPLHDLSRCDTQSEIRNRNVMLLSLLNADYANFGLAHQAKDWYKFLICLWKIILRLDLEDTTLQAFYNMSTELSTNVQNLLVKNTRFVTTFQALPTIAEFGAILAANPETPRICIIACCDPRVVPESIFGLSMGEAIVMRTAGGSIEPALAGMLAIDSLAPLTDVIIMRHTDCGTAYWTDEGVKMALEERCGREGMVGRRGEKVEEMSFCASTGNEGDEKLLRADVDWLKASPLVRERTKGRIVGMLYVTETGEVKVVCQ